MKTQADKDLREARALKARFDRGERDFGRNSKAGPMIVATIVAVVSIFATLDPFGWFSGPPHTASARGEIRAACVLMAIPLFCAWFVLVRPLRTGAVVDYRKYGRTEAVLRSDEPSRFWFNYWCYALLLVLMLGLGVYALIGGVRELKKSQPTPNERSGVDAGRAPPFASLCVCPAPLTAIVMPRQGFA